MRTILYMKCNQRGTFPHPSIHKHMMKLWQIDPVYFDEKSIPSVSFLLPLLQKFQVLLLAVFGAGKFLINAILFGNLYK